VFHAFLKLTFSCRMGNYVTEPEEARFYGTQLFDLVGSGKLKLKIFKEYDFSAEVRASST
jgi:hypothetical protein